MKINSRFTKKAVSIIVSAAMLLSQGTAIHAEGGEGQVISLPVAETTVSGIESECTDDELLLGYFESKLTGRETYAISNSANFQGRKKTVYDAVVAAAKSIAAGQRDSTTVTVPLTITAQQAGVGSITSENVYDAVNIITNEVDIKTVVSCALRDYPYEFYWFDKTEGYSSGGSISYNAESATYDYTLKFSPDALYKGTDEYTVNTGKTGAASAAATNAKAIVNTHSGKTVLERLTAYKDEICALVSYNDGALGDYDSSVLGLSPWQVIYVFDGDEDTNVVCEGYAKAFQYLCDLDFANTYEILCYSVSGIMEGGTGAGRHMWNIVTLGEKNYLVDVTNCDAGTIGNPDELFLKGMTKISEASSYSRTINEDTIIFTYDDGSEENTTSMASIFGTDVLVLSATDYTPAVVTPFLEASHVTLSSTPLTYNGSAQTPTITVKVGETTLVEGTDYTVMMPSDITNAGTKTITISGIGNYSGTVVKTYTIERKDLSETAAITLDKDSYIYTGWDVIPVVTVKDGEKTLTEDTDYVVMKPDDITNVGTKTITIVYIGNYIGVFEKTYTIAKKDLSETAAITLDKESYNYTGEAVTPVVTVKDGEKTLTEGIDYTVEVTDNTGVGTGTVTVTFKGNYTGTASKTFEITVQVIEVHVFNTEGNLGGEGWEYHGTTDHVLVLSRENCLYKVIITQDANIDHTENYGTITDGQLYGVVHNYGTISGGSFSEGGIYGIGDVYNSEGGVISGGTFNGYVPNDGTINGGSFKTIDNIGVINITGTEGNYSVTVSEGTSGNGKVFINGTEHTHTVDEGGYQNRDDNVHLKSGICNSCPLKYSIPEIEEEHFIHKTQADGNNIELLCACGKTMAEVTIGAPDDLTYSGTEKKAQLSGDAADSGLDEDDIQYYDVNGANIGAAPVDVGTYKAMIGLDGVNAEVDFTIAPKDISELSAPVPSELYYEGRTQNIVFSFTYGDYYLQAVTDYDMTGTVSAENAGTYTVTMTGKKNFTGTITAEWTINPSEIAQLTAFLDAEGKEVEFTKEYDGTKGFNGEIATVSFKNQKGTPMTLAVGNGAAVDVVFADAAAGATTCTAEITLSGETRNNFVEESYVFSGLTAEIIKKKAKVTVAPTPIELAYKEEPQKLVTEGTAENGTMQYGINDGNSWTWTETVPEKTDGGEYKVYYRAKAVDNNFADSDFDETTDFVTVIIEKVTPQFVYTKNSPIYTGEEHELLTINLLSPGCVVEYSFDRTNWSTDIPKGKEAGVYRVYYRIKGTNNYSDYSGNNFDVTIAKATPDTSTIPEPVASEITYGQTLSQSVLENGWKWTDETKLPSVGESCEAYYTVDDKNYDYSNVTGYDAERHAIVMSAIITVNKADVTVKADDKYIVVGAELPEATYTVDGLVEDDSLVTAPTIGYSGADNMTIGEYDIVVKGADAGDNYEVTHVNGKLYVGLCDHNGTTKQSYDTEYHWNYCTKCGQTDMEKKAHNGGTATCTKQAVCKDCNIPYGKAKGHSWKTEWSSNSTHHWHECGNADCPVTADSGKDGYGAHTFGEWTTVTAPTATAKGTEKHSCICGYEETRDVPPTGSSGGNGGSGIVDPGIRPPISTTTTHIITGAPDWSPNPSRPATTTTTTTTTRPPEDDEEIDDDIYEEDDSAEPQIKGDNGKMGWDVIEDEILDAEEGDAVTVDMNGATEVPEDILEQIQGKDIDLVIELENGAVWTINGESVTDPSDIDLGVEFDADIPVKVINSVTGESDYITISIAHDGEFGFTAVLTVDMGDENEGLYANLYWYTDGGAEFICADKINSRGKADLTFTHASDYIIVIDEDNHGKRAEESADGDVDDEIVTDEDDDANPFTAVTISFTGVIVSAAAVMLSRKRRK